MAFFTDKSLDRMKGYHPLRSQDPSAAPRTYEAQVRDRRGKLLEGVVTISLVPGTKERVGSFLDLTHLKRAQWQMVRADKRAALGQVRARSSGRMGSRSHPPSDAPWSIDGVSGRLGE